MKTFTLEIQLEKPSSRVEGFVNYFNSLPLSGDVYVVVLDAKTIDNTNSILGTIQFSLKETKASFKVVESSMERLSAFASRYNMCSAHYCDIKLSLVNRSLLKIEFIPPNETYEKVINDFFNATSFPRVQ